MRLALFLVLFLAGCAGNGLNEINKPFVIEELNGLNTLEILKKIEPIKSGSYCEIIAPDNVFQIKKNENGLIINAKEYVDFANQFFNAKIDNGYLEVGDSRIELFPVCGWNQTNKIHKVCKVKYKKCASMHTLSGNYIDEYLLTEATYLYQNESVESEKLRLASLRQNEINRKKNEAKKKAAEQKRSEDRRLAAEAFEKNKLAALEKKCSSFGYNKGTEKFADCMRELYVLEAQAKSEAKSNSETQARINRENQATQQALESVRQQTEALKRQAEAAERARQADALMNLGNSIMNQGRPKIECNTYGNNTTCY